MQNLTIHFGLHKTGTSFLQQKVFPAFEGVSVKVRKGWEGLFQHRFSPGEKMIVSDEGLLGSPFFNNKNNNDNYKQEGGWFENHITGIRNVGRAFPDAKIILGVTRHDELLASLYKQYIQKGGARKRNEFFNVDSEKGVISKSDLYLWKRIEAVRKNFKKNPFVFLRDELKNNFESLLEDLGNYLNVEAPSAGEIDRTPENKGINHYQGRMLRLYNRMGRIPLFEKRWFRRRDLSPRFILQNRLRFLSDRPITLIKKQQEYVREKYKHGWRKVVDYVDESRFGFEGDTCHKPVWCDARDCASSKNWHYEDRSAVVRL